MKFSAFVALITASVALATPAAISLERATRLVRDGNGNEIMNPCVQCPCSGFDPSTCRCVPQGCCCPK
ncbi:hypothetical protein K469DRAFT_553062 [Zopfia rhizophila CBS 207.26]|uniref:Uncharacterized protein n=1 Tax=Zopfia rhizophila CBS 207.26 TaxID=1314779 RepID=A0A6A6EN87_9PEZI|nr:hypothetical protein K469DRAFT_553062 [Zopfia rhizophila CBS 207.26]